MIIRKLEPQEHYKTRTLYETVFFEDDQKFVDYYYTWKTRDNTIYVAEDENGIHSMIHLNPFDVWVDGQVQKLHYIVAVATQEEYRHQGLMRRLLETVENEMAEDGEVFTFLMPASEKIYYPFGYRYFVRQIRGALQSGIGFEGILEPAESSGESEKLLKAAGIPESCSCFCRPVRPVEYQKLADSMNSILEQQCDVFIYRNAAYYERLCAEQHCQNGKVMVVVRFCGEAQEEIIGSFCTAHEKEFTMRELILEPAYVDEIKAALDKYAEDFGCCKVEGCNLEGILGEEVWLPFMMGKVPGKNVFQAIWNEKRIFINEIV